MTLDVESDFPHFVAQTQDGANLDSKSFTSGSWLVFFSYPADFTPICSTEIMEFARNAGEFTRRNCKMIGISKDSNESHNRWINDLQSISSTKIDFPLVADETGRILQSMGMVKTQQRIGSGLKRERTTSPLRALYIVDPRSVVQYVQVMPAATGRSISETLRVLDSLQLSYLQSHLGTPAEWRTGQDAVLLTDDSETDVKVNERVRDALFPYLRFVNVDTKGV